MTWTPRQTLDELQRAGLGCRDRGPALRATLPDRLQQGVQPLQQLAGLLAERLAGLETKHDALRSWRIDRVRVQPDQELEVLRVCHVRAELQRVVGLVDMQ